MRYYGVVSIHRLFAAEEDRVLGTTLPVAAAAECAATGDPRTTPLSGPSAAPGARRFRERAEGPPADVAGHLILVAVCLALDRRRHPRVGARVLHTAEFTAKAGLRAITTHELP